MRLASSLILALLAGVGHAQENPEPVEQPPAAADPKPALEYYFAFAAASSPDSLQQVLQAYTSSDAVLLLLSVSAGVEVPADVLTKPVLVVGDATTPGTRLHQQGSDSFLVIEPHTQGVDEGQLHRVRRDARASRWSIGFAHRYEPLQYPRMDITLFHDDPVDIFITTESSLLLGGPTVKMPYGHTLLFGPNVEEGNVLQFFGVSESGISPYNPEVPAEVEGEPAPLP